MSSILTAPSILDTPSNAQVLAQQQIDSAANRETKKYLFAAALLVGAVWVILKLRK